MPSAATARSKGDDDRTKKRASLRGEGARGGAAAGGRAQQGGAAVCEAVLAACPCGERRWGEEDERVIKRRPPSSLGFICDARRPGRERVRATMDRLALFLAEPAQSASPCRLAWRARTERSKRCLASTWSRKRKLARLALDDEPCASLSLSFHCSRSSCTTKLRPYEQHRSARPAAEEPRKPVEQSNLQAASIPASASKPTCPRTRSARRTPRFFPPPRPPRPPLLAGSARPRSAPPRAPRVDSPLLLPRPPARQLPPPRAAQGARASRLRPASIARGL